MATTTNKAWQKDDDTTAIDQDAFINAFLDDLDASLFGRGANSAKPGSPNNGDTFYDTDASRFIKYNGSAWVQVMPDAVNVIDSDHYVDGSIDTVHLSADAVTGAKIADDALDSEHYTDGSIDTAHLAADVITGAKIADDAVDSEHYVDGSIDTAHLAADVVTGAKIADDALDSEHYTDGSIDAAHLASSAVTTAKIDGDAVTGAKIADDAIDSEHYTDGSIDTAHIADNQVTLAKLSDGTQGGILYYASGGAPTELSAGTSGYFLKTQGGSANPVWAAVTGGFTQKVVNVSFFSLTGNGSSGGAVANNDAFYLPIDVTGDMTITKISLYIATSSGNIDVGLYDSSGTRLVSKGSTASPGTGVQTLTVASTSISAGQHYLALAVDNTTFKWGQATGADTMATRMMQRETSDFPLPSSFTVGAWPTALSSAIGPPGLVLS